MFEAFERLSLKHIDLNTQYEAHIADTQKKFDKMLASIDNLKIALENIKNQVSQLITTTTRHTLEAFEMKQRLDVLENQNDE
jgi:predicted  nucleic acid-binding Zn-ribbon protein